MVVLINAAVLFKKGNIYKVKSGKLSHTVFLKQNILTLVPNTERIRWKVIPSNSISIINQSKIRFSFSKQCVVEFTQLYATYI